MYNVIYIGHNKGIVTIVYRTQIIKQYITTTCLSVPGVCVIMYTDDILLTAPSVCGLDALHVLVKTCEFELDKLDMVVNTVNHVVYE